MTSVSIVTKTINDIHITPVVPNGGEPDLSKIKGSDFIPSLYANVFICAKKKSGKTNVIHTMIKHLVSPSTRVFIFASTVYKDKTWRVIRKMLDQEEIEYEAFTSFLNDDGSSLIPEILKDPEGQGDEKPTDQLTRENQQTQRFDLTLKASRPLALDRGFLFGTHGGLGPGYADNLEQKVKKPKFQSPEYLFVFDDLGQDLRHNSVSQLLKTNRHHKAKVILSSQWVTDLHPQAIKQLDYCLLFRSFSHDKLEKIHELLDLGNSLPEFLALYAYATAEPFQFLYIDVRNEKYRKNFNEEIDIAETSDM